MTTEKSDIEVVLDWVSAPNRHRRVEFECCDTSRPDIELLDFDLDGGHFHAFADTREEAFREARAWIERQG